MSRQARSRSRCRLLATGLRVALLAVCAAGAAWADPGALRAQADDPTREAVARAGEYCTPAACRPRHASLATGAAFGATVLAIGWQARRREPRES
jgi:hypothetical protein